MRGYFIFTNNMVDPSRVYCKKCGAQAEEKGGNWFATTGQDTELKSALENANHISRNNLCPDCVQTVLIEAIKKEQKSVQYILENMKDTADPVEGAAFEKTVETSFEDFCAFMLSAYDNVTMEKHTEAGSELYLFYNGDKATDHIGSYIPFKKSGCFGGIRVGSKNSMRKPGDPDVKNPFNDRRARA